ncbi:hypothetical protein E1211_28980 [Micromonospora sp. 15K316]|uniref:hypothetical protein n=1 Tax=Micromonospora sp. 15K316 TaxID=2530376 RepID=UPI00104E7577|nr:hypothetical protein [Micromonospora sp. 15K316]TDC27657.1 hypothetical protein E1211_28980 [Micromonospora sp. 15K316]
MEQLLYVAGAVTAVGGALLLVFRAVDWMIRTVRKLSRLADDLLGEDPRPGLPGGRPGLMDRMATLEQSQTDVLDRLDALEELRTNGGGSIKDTVNRIAEATGARRPHAAP